MDIQELRREAQTMQPQLTADRRRLHRNPEAGAVLPETVAYVKKRLTEMGYHPQELGGGLTATVTGTDTGRCILLRADMDALRGQEQSGLPFQSENGCMHACGHDMHTAMLLGAAQLLMQHRQELSGTVKLVFQPDEEGFTGAKSMLAAGVLQIRPPERRWLSTSTPAPPPERCCAAAGPSWRAVPCSASRCGERAATGPCRRRAWTPSASPPRSGWPCRRSPAGSFPPRPRQW